MNRFIKYSDFSENFLSDIKSKVLNKFNIDLDEEFNSLTTYLGEIEFTKKIDTLFQKVYIISNIIDNQSEYSINPFIFYKYDLMEQNSNYYTICNTQKIEKINNDSFENITKNLNYYANRETDRYDKAKYTKNTIMQYQITRILRSCCFIQDILFDIYLSYKYNRREFRHIELNNYLSECNVEEDNLINGIKRFNNSNLSNVSFQIHSSIIKNEVKMDFFSLDYIFTYLANPALHNLYSINYPKRGACSYQSIEKLNTLFKEKRFESEIIESRYLAEKTTGLNLAVHLYSFMNDYIDNENVIECITKLSNIILQYPNTFTRLYLLDEVLCLSCNNNFNLEDYNNYIFPILNDNIEKFKYKYDVISKIVYYLISKIIIKNKYESNDPLKTINLLLLDTYKQNIPWSINSFDGLLINSYPTDIVKAQFSGTTSSSDKYTNFYKSIQNEVIKTIFNSNSED